MGRSPPRSAGRRTGRFCSEATHDGVPSPRRSHYNAKLDAEVVWVGEGEYQISRNPADVLTTILGSCVAVCIRDPETGWGGMNHFVLPYETGAGKGLPSVQLRYGSYSIERLVNALIARGSCRERLEIKVFGGANVIKSSGNIGHRNADFVESYLAHEGLAVAVSQLRGTAPRKIRYYPTTGRVLMRVCKPEQVPEALETEAYLPFDPALVRPSKTVLFEPPPGQRKRTEKTRQQ